MPLNKSTPYLITIWTASAMWILIWFISSCTITGNSAGRGWMATAPQTGKITRSLTIHEKQRYYLLYIPKDIDRTKAVPLILAFHGGGSNPEQFAKVSQLNERGGEHLGYIIAYPAGYKNFWHAGDNCCGPPYEENIDDVAFVQAVVKDIVSILRIDEKRIFATGYSNGGNMTYRLACELSEQIAAVAINASSLGLSTCKPKRPMPVLHFHGTADTFHPYEGGPGVTEFNYLKLGAPETILRWAKWNECTDERRVTYKKGAATCITRSHCKQNAEVTLCTIEGMGHQWPGFTVRFPRGLARKLGPGTDDLSATDMLLSFFQKHPMPENQ